MLTGHHYAGPGPAKHLEWGYAEPRRAEADGSYAFEIWWARLGYDVRVADPGDNLDYNDVLVDS